MNNEAEMKKGAKRVLRALENMREGRWRYFVMPPQDRLDAAWIWHRYDELCRKLIFTEASMQAGTEFLLMVIRGDETVIRDWAETNPMSWCPNCEAYRLQLAGKECPGDGCSVKLVPVELEEEWEEYKGSVLYQLTCGAIDLSAAAMRLSVDEETVREWLIPSPPRQIVVDALPPITPQEALDTVRRVAGIEK